MSQNRVVYVDSPGTLGLLQLMRYDEARGANSRRFVFAVRTGVRSAHEYPATEEAMSRQIGTKSRPTTGGRSERVLSLERGLAVMRAFRDPDSALTISEVAERTGLSRATVRRILLTLHELGYVAVDRRAFSLTAEVLELAKPFVTSGDPWEFAKPYLQSLTDRLGESASARSSTAPRSCTSPEPPRVD